MNYKSNALIVFFSRMHISFDGVQFEKYFRASLYNSAILEPGAKDMVQYLHSKYELYIASNGPYLQQKHRVELAGLLMYFKDAFISEDIGASKPAHEFFEEAMRRINHDRAVKIQKDEVLMIGDSLSSDISGSKAFGIHTCFYNKTQRNDIPSFVEHVVDSLEKVKTIV